MQKLPSFILQQTCEYDLKWSSNILQHAYQGIERYSSVWEHKLRVNIFCKIQRLSGLPQNIKQMGSQCQFLAGVQGAKPQGAPSF